MNVYFTFRMDRLKKRAASSALHQAMYFAENNKC